MKDKNTDASKKLQQKLDEMRLPTMRPADQEIDQDDGAKGMDMSSAGLGGAQGKPVLRPADKPIKDDMAQNQIGVAQPDANVQGQGQQDAVDPTYYDNDAMYAQNYYREALEKIADGIEVNLSEAIESKDAKLRSDFKRSLNESFSVLLEETDGLSEDFKEKTKTIFEAAVDERMGDLKDNLVEACTKIVTEAKKKVASNMLEEVDRYLSYVAEEWMTENQLAVETSLRSMVAETFMEDLKGLFAKHQIMIPESDINLMDRALEKIESLEEELSEQIKKNVNLSEKVKKAEREEILESCLTGLTKTQEEKVKKLTEGFEFSNVDKFKDKVKTIVESVTKEGSRGSSKMLTEDVTGPVEGRKAKVSDSGDLHPDVAAVLSALKKR